MPCYSPLPAFRLAGGGISLSARPSERISLSSPSLYLPCNSCVGCLKTRARHWALRCSFELLNHREACWATLTYDDDHLPPTLSKPHLSGFLKRLRARYPSGAIRFFASGEYGDKFGRPHYHPILFGMDDEKVIQSCWPFGKAKRHDLRPEGIAYVAGYVNKKFKLRDLPGELIDYETGEVYQYQPAFTQMSKRPGLGAHMREHWRSWRTHAIMGGKPIPVPRFFHKAWQDHAPYVEQMLLEGERRAQQEPLDYDRLQAGEQIAHAALQRSSEGRSL